MRTSEKTPSTTFVNKYMKKSRLSKGGTMKSGEYAYATYNPAIQVTR